MYSAVMKSSKEIEITLSAKREQYGVDIVVLFSPTAPRYSKSETPVIPGPNLNGGFMPYPGPILGMS